MNIEMWPIARPIPYAANARRLNARAVDAIAASIKEFGFRQPIVVDVEDVIVVGHTRLLGAKKLGLATVPVHVASELTAAQIKAYRLMDNRSTENSEWDLELLEAEMAGLVGELDLALTGFSERELAKLLAASAPVDEDELPLVPDAPVTRAGDLWLMGEHRLLCGDCTVGADVERLMDGRRAGLMNTDPPYGVSLRLEDNHDASNSAKGVDKTYRHFEAIMGDDLDGPKLQEFLESAFSVAIPVLCDDAAWYLWHAQLSQGFFAAAAAAAAQLLVHRQIIWVKPHFVFGRGDYHWQHELCFYGWRKGNRPPFLGERNQSTTWVLEEGGGTIRKDQSHPTQKPVELFRRPILNHLKPGELCYEPFAGSGSQFIAAEELERACYGLEIMPTYCDVIVQRWQNFTGKTATLDGATFAEVKAQRATEPAKKESRGRRKP
jgi:DNA modification methylase